MTVVDENIFNKGSCPDKLYLFKVCGKTSSALTKAVEFHLQGGGNTLISFPDKDGGNFCPIGVSLSENLPKLNISFDVTLDKSSECGTPVCMSVYGQTSVSRNDMTPSALNDHPCGHCCSAYQTEPTSFARGHKRNSSSHLYVKGAINQTEVTIPEYFPTQKDPCSHTVSAKEASVTVESKNSEKHNSADNIDSFLDEGDVQIDNEPEAIMRQQESDQRSMRSKSCYKQNSNKQIRSKLMSENVEIKNSINVSQKSKTRHIEGLDCVDSGLHSLEDNNCVINDSSNIVADKYREKRCKLRGCHDEDLLDLKTSSVSNGKCHKAYDKTYNIAVGDLRSDDSNSENNINNDSDCDNVNNNIRTSAFVTCDNIDNKNCKANHLPSDMCSKPKCDENENKSFTKPKGVCEIAKNREDINNNVNECSDNTERATHVRLQEAIQRSFTKFLYEIDLMEFSDSLYEQFVLDMNTYECLFEMWQLDKNRLDAKRKLLLYLSRGLINKANFEQAVWKSSHYPLLDAFFPKT